MPEWKVPGYTELKRIGSGGFGEVVLARHDPSGVLVAIKYLRHDLVADPEFTEMFRREAQVLASLDDPDIVRLYEYVESPAGAAIVMELVAGVSLREILTYQGKTTAEAALTVLNGSLLGLAAAHRRGIVHRDYKPENVLVNGDGVSKLTDFGIAERTGGRPVPSGTLHYAAPEQIAGAPASPAGDIYAATATFYECLTGRPPFTGESAELIRQHRFAPVPLDPVPEPLRPLMAAGMAKDPRYRPGNAAALAAELNTAASGAYGPDWAHRGQRHLGEAALLLAALWPSGPPPAVESTAVHRIPLHRGSRVWRVSAVKAAIAAATVIAVAAAGTALAATGSPQPTAQNHPATVVKSVSLQLSPTQPSPTQPSPTQPSTTVTVTVPANGGWIDTGLQVGPSDQVTISASGSWSPDGGADVAGPDGFGYSLESADNYFNTADLGVCATCATTDYPFWAELISYTGNSPPEPGSYTSTAVATQAALIDGVGSSLQTSQWPYTGELWLGFNDDAYSGNTADNQGQVTAVITVTQNASS